MKLRNDSYPVQPEDAGYALSTISRIPEVTRFGWRSEDQSLHWTVDVPRGEEACCNLSVRTRLQRAISLHKPQ